MAEIDLRLTEAKQATQGSGPMVKVEIYNQTYNIRSDGDSEYLTQLADFVDSRMREISSGTLTVDSLKVAILAALHIADELMRLKQSSVGPHEVLEDLWGDSRSGMLQARGLWKNRDDLPDFGKIRREWDRL